MSIVSITTETLDVRGRARTMIIARDNDNTGARSDDRAPIVLVFHGSNQTAQKFREFTANAFDRLADESGAVVGYLDGYRKHWNDARRSQDFATRREGYDDVAFAEAAVDLLSSHYHGDDRRVFAVGYSNGGQLVIRLIHEIPTALTGAALISATQPDRENFWPDATDAAPVPVVLFHGTKDPLVPYEGGMASLWGFRPRGRGLSAPATARYYADRNRITTAPTTMMIPGRERGMYAERTDFREDGHQPVTLYTVHGSGHTVPGTKRAFPIVGHTFLALDTVAEIQDFFGLPATPTDQSARTACRMTPPSA
ncbi:alpha/beta hydrolase family esterase [Microlunatus soli]|uniref:Polyhydroxybutyrate depolymerase n=1 Tax=Microlunatus soli TaxID=630515 RepID=A0A1H1V916_9ACTN|nr:PHB depolymerase family esterase [Microlunatus soli]SDS81238.1 polyhydroxybutyrate depolymerase [Microlunatus soli]